MDNNEKNRVAIKQLTLQSILLDPKSQTNYIVPRYQREYAWTRIEIERMLTDLWESFQNDSSRNYYFGTFVCKPWDTENQDLFDVIDGQQRLTTFILLSPWLSNRDAPKQDIELKLKFANRVKVNGFLQEYLRVHLSDRVDNPGDNEKKVNDFFKEYLRAQLSDGEKVNDYLEKDEKDLRAQLSEKDLDEIPSFMDAISILMAYKPSIKDGSLLEKSIGTGLLNIEVEDNSKSRNRMSFRQYILEKVILFRVTMPIGTDAMAYFEVMNNRGEQLQYHELLKAELLEKLFEKCQEEQKDYSDLSDRFNRFWTACSKMDGHLIDHMHACIKLKNNACQWSMIGRKELGNKDDEGEGPWGRQSVIRDFAVFLMHVLRIYVHKPLKKSCDEISLDERSMKSTYEKYNKNIDPIVFMNILIDTRLAFDRYVVKAKMVDGEVESWKLKEIFRRDDNSPYEAKNTFEDSDNQKKLIALESALQVSNTDQRHKEWLHAILEAPEDERSNPEKLLALLEKHVAERIQKDKERNVDCFYCQGLQTSHLVLNVIDYLMWCKSTFEKETSVRLTIDEKEQEVPVKYFFVPDKITFKNYNSVEHHHAQNDGQNPEKWTRKQIDDIGNLFLIYSTENSSMSNREPHEKKNRYMNSHGKDLPDSPKRRWMYDHTTEDGVHWSLKNMKELSAYVKKLVEDFLEAHAPDKNGTDEESL